MIRTGTLLDNRYEILGKIGSGGMADVYKAKCRKLGRYVAVKVLKPEYSNDEHFLAKFSAEAQAAARLAHPNIVNVYDVGEEKDLHYIVLELVEGITLKQYIEKKGKLEIRESIGIAMQIAQGMETAHEHKIVHRDIKPQNIMISKDGKVKVTDFGIAKAPSSQTINSATMGSVHYISPEQARGGYCDERSDIYSLGITMYEMLTGHVPYEGDSAVAVALLHIQGEMDSPLKYDSMIPVSLEKIILKCTQKKPEMRYANVSLLIADLRRALMTPDEDFVKIVPITSAEATRVMSEDEMSQIKEGISLDLDSDEDTDFFFDEEQDYLMGIEPDISGDDDELDEDDSEDDEDEEETSKSEKIIFGVIIGVAVLILFLVIFLLLQFFGIIGRKGPVDDPSTGTQQTTEAVPDETEAPTSAANKIVKMPDLSGMNEEEIEKALEKMGLIPKFRYQ
ncbi:MAG: Stk1 family PASTA domain-containing Ser/Thr kinase, partial [Lachnospiraceae bacterium]|nr:Stk1 family PASTA domain-containing Ser/Thr kinase [Lachnospiraceae bacterium]